MTAMQHEIIEMTDPASTDGIRYVIQFIFNSNGRVIHETQLSHVLAQCGVDLTLTNEQNWSEQFQKIATLLGNTSAERYEQPDPARLPAITWLPNVGWSVIKSQSSAGTWLIDHQGTILERSLDEPLPVIQLRLIDSGYESAEQPVRKIFKDAFLKHKKIFIEGAGAGAFINILALATSLYSMQVYDRVIPSQGYATLLVLTLGVALSVFFELILKIIRSHLIEHAVVDIDSQLSREIFSRLLHIRLDQLPNSVGSLSSQIRGYETIRSFLSSSTFYILVDAPFGLFFIALIAFIANPLIALVPLFFLIFSVAMGIAMRRKIDHHAKKATAAANFKTGLLVETIEGAETIKAGGGSWNALSRWLDIVDESIKHELGNRSISEISGYLAAALQQVSYVGLVAAGAYFASEGDLTMGSLIACSILSGRALGPIAQIPNLMVQRAHAKAALEGLEKVYALEIDNHGIDRPLMPESIKGNYDLEQVKFAYAGSPQALEIPKLHIRAGEKIGVIGPIGSGKSTFLRLLSGMYQANEGKILLDNLDIRQISRPLLASNMAYLQQDHRLFNGTLRQNLLIGTPDPGDTIIHEAAVRTGLMSVISHHPKGLDLLITEGGKGLSGGQRQLVALTRLLLSDASIWLLDEPTASMDELSEQRSIQVLSEAIRSNSTLVLVTHKAALLSQVERLIVVSDHQIIMDGPRDAVITKLQELAKKKDVPSPKKSEVNPA